MAFYDSLNDANEYYGPRRKHRLLGMRDRLVLPQANLVAKGASGHFGAGAGALAIPGDFTLAGMAGLRLNRGVRSDALQLRADAEEITTPIRLGRVGIR